MVARHAYFVVAIWIALAAGLNVAVPQLEKVVAQKSGSFIPDSAPSLVTIKNMGRQFGESQSTAIGYLVFENNGGLNDADRLYYRDLVAELAANRSKIDSVQDLVGDPATAPIGASQDGKAIYAVIRFYGGMGSAAQLGGQDFTQSVLDQKPAPPGLKVYLTGPAPTIGEEIKSEDHAVLVITGLSVIMIVALLLFVYRSAITIIVPLATVGLALAVSRPIVAMLATHAGLEVSIFTVMLLAALILGGGTDYAIFLISVYHEHRRKGMSCHDSIVCSSTKVSGVIVASGLTVAASCAVMAFTHIVLFRTVGIPCSIGVVVAVLAAVTLVPALTSIFGRHGYMEPKQARHQRFWRRWGVWVVRKPVISLAASLLILAVLAAQVPWMSTGYNEQAMQSKTTTANQGYNVIARHYGPDELTPDYILVESDHDLRTNADFSALNAIARAISKVPGVKEVRGPTQPEGRPVPEFTLRFQAGALAAKLTDAVDALRASLPKLHQLMEGVGQLQDGLGRISSGAGLATDGSDKIQQGSDQLRVGLNGALEGSGQLSVGSDRTSHGASELADGISAAVTPILGLLDQLAPSTVDSPCVANSSCSPDDQLAALSQDTTIVGQIRYQLTRLKLGSAQLADGNRRLADGTHQLRDGLTALANGSVTLENGQTLLTSKLRELAAGTTSAKTGMQQIADGMAQITPQTQTLIDGLTQARDLLKGASDGVANDLDAGFYVPNQAFQDPRLITAMNYFLSKDGRTARFVILGNSTAFSSAAIDRLNAIVSTTGTSKAGTSLDGGRVQATGLAAGFRDLHHMVNTDFAVIAICALVFIFVILALLLRSLVAPLYMIATIAVSYLGALGICKLVWQDLLGIDTYWAVPALSFVALVAVGSDYNMLFMARVRDESTLGLRSGLIKALATTGGVITTAGVIFAVTMLALLASPTQNISQVGFTIGAGLLLDTFIVRAVTVPAIAALLGTKNWWPGARDPRRSIVSGKFRAPRRIHVERAAAAMPLVNCPTNSSSNGSTSPDVGKSRAGQPAPDEMANA